METESKREKSFGSTKPAKSERETTTSKTRTDPVDSLHQAVGNQAVQRLYRTGGLQANLEVGQANDDREREAERVADEVIHSAGSNHVSVSNDTIHQRSGTGSGPRVVEKTGQQIESLRHGGRPLPPDTRSFFESRFGRDFSDVQVHTGVAADDVARSIDARAFTIGPNIAFRTGEYDPSTDSGKRLLAHELTHVIQQADAATNSIGSRGMDGLAGPDGAVQKRPTEPTVINRQKATESSSNQKVEMGAETWVQNRSTTTFDGSPGTIAQIYFPTGGATLDEEDKETLDTLDRQMLEQSLAFDLFHSFRLRLKGYTDRRGSSKDNQLLAFRRVASVVNYIRTLDSVSQFAQMGTFEGIEDEIVGEAGPETGEFGELARYRRVEVVLEGTTRAAPEQEPVIAPTKVRLPNWLPERAREAIQSGDYSQLEGARVQEGLYRLQDQGEGPFGDVIIWTNSAGSGYRKVQAFQMFPEDRAFYRNRLPQRSQRQIEIFYQVLTRYNKELWKYVKSADMSIAQARVKLQEDAASRLKVAAFEFVMMMFEEAFGGLAVSGGAGRVGRGSRRGVEEPSSTGRTQSGTGKSASTEGSLPESKNRPSGRRERDIGKEIEQGKWNVTVLKRNAIENWQRGGEYAPAKVVPVNRGVRARVAGYFTEKRAIRGATPEEMEEILGFPDGYLTRHGGAIVQEFEELPKLDQFVPRGYTQLPGGKTYEPGGGWPPGTGVPQWILTDAIPARPLDTVTPGQRFSLE